jgi:hypothetical protein
MHTGDVGRTSADRQLNRVRISVIDSRSSPAAKSFASPRR